MKFPATVLLLLFMFSCNTNNMDKIESKISFYEKNCDYLKLFGEKCISELNDTTLYILLEYNAFRDTSLIISICKHRNTYLLRTIYIDPIENFNLKYLSHSNDSLELIYGVHTSEISANKVEKILKLFARYNFWNLSFLIREEDVFDGGYISIRIMNSGKRHRVVRRDESNSGFIVMVDSVFTILGLKNISSSSRHNKYLNYSPADTLNKNFQTVQ